MRHLLFLFAITNRWECLDLLALTIETFLPSYTANLPTEHPLACFLEDIEA
jgi:hypothetical protein